VSTVNIALVGLGFMGEAHATCYRRDARVRLAAVADLDAERRREFCGRFAVGRSVADWRELLADPGIDVVDVTAPNFLHAEIAEAAIRAGKGLIVEKPLALDLAAAGRVLQALREKPVLAMYAENRLFAPVFVKARDCLRQGDLGEPLILRVNELGSGPTHSRWFWDRSRTGGGAQIDLGIHGLCMAEWLLDSPIVSVQALTGTLRWKDRAASGVEDSSMAMVRFANGAFGQFICSWGIQGGLDIRAELFGSTGSLYLDQSTTINGLRVYQSEAVGGGESRPHQASRIGWSYPVVDEWNVKGHSAELRHYVDCFLAGRQTESPLSRGYRALRLVLAIYEAAAAGRELAVSEGLDE